VIEKVRHQVIRDQQVWASVVIAAASSDDMTLRLPAPFRTTTQRRPAKGGQ
jgi:hypothetical protein